MAAKIAVDFDIIASHASRVQQVGDSITMAAQAAGSINVGGGAFGLMCAFMVPPVSAVSSLARGAIDAASELVDRSAVEIRGLGRDFQTFEDNTSQQLDRIKQDGLG